MVVVLKMILRKRNGGGDRKFGFSVPVFLFAERKGGLKGFHNNFGRRFCVYIFE